MIEATLKDEYADNPCRKCDFSTRQSCCGCLVYFEWKKKQDDKGLQNHEKNR